MDRFRITATSYALAVTIFVLAAVGWATQASAQALGWTVAPTLEGYRPVRLANNGCLTENTLPSYQYVPSYSCQQGNLSWQASLPAAAPINHHVCDTPPIVPPCNPSLAAAGCTAVSDPRTAVWGGRAGALLLYREDENHRFFSYDSTNEAFQLLDSQQSNFEEAFGVEAHVVRKDLCTGITIEGVYWGMYPEASNAYADPSQVAGNLNGIFNFDQLDYNGVTANNFVDGAMVHRLRRETEIHNAELNRMWELSPCSCPRSRWSIQGLAGIRYFRFVDNLQFASDPADTAFTGTVDELYYTTDVDNDLIGFQLGGFADRNLADSRWSFTCGAKAGVYLNDADAHSHIGGAAGTATINNGPNNGAAWNVVASKEDVAFLAELEAGLAVRLNWHWRLRADYRVVAVSGVALPTNQIYQDLRGLQDVSLLSSNGDLVLHGISFGAERRY